MLVSSTIEISFYPRGACSPQVLTPPASANLSVITPRSTISYSHPNSLDISDMDTIVNVAGLGFSGHWPALGIRRRAVIVRAEAEGVGVAINPAIRKSEEKVVDSVLVAELSKPLTAYCRCWRSGTFPLCDGSHVKHNKATGDNVGPLLLKKPKE